MLNPQSLKPRSITVLCLAASLAVAAPAFSQTNSQKNAISSGSQTGANSGSSTSRAIDRLSITNLNTARRLKNPVPTVQNRSPTK